MREQDPVGVNPLEAAGVLQTTSSDPGDETERNYRYQHQYGVVLLVGVRRGNHQIARQAKVFASFSGRMRSNLVAMLDDIGVARWLGLSTTASLWERDSHLIHCTSAIRYPVFVDGKNWAGNPNMLRSADMREWLEAYTGTELTLLKDALLVPLGPKVGVALEHLAARGLVDRNRILDGMPHPSTANSERIAYFLGNKPAGKLSDRTNPAAMDAIRSNLLDRIAAL